MRHMHHITVSQIWFLVYLMGTQMNNILIFIPLVNALQRTSHWHSRGWIGPSFSSQVRGSCSCGIWSRGMWNRIYYWTLVYWIVFNSKVAPCFVIKPRSPQTHDCWCFLNWTLIQVKGQGIYAFVTLLEDVEYSEELRKALINAVRSQVTTR